MNRYQSIREECCEANRALPAMGLADLTFGNVSVLDSSAGVFAIKPSGVAYDCLCPEDMVIVDLDGNVVEGTLRYSSDTPTHRHLFLSFPGMKSVVHTHSRHAVAFAQAGREIPCLGTTHADYFHHAVPVTRQMTKGEVADNYEWNTGIVIAERFVALNPLEIPAVLVHGHGPFTWGSSAAKAVETAQALEIIAQMARNTLLLNPSVFPLSSALHDKHFLRKHGTNAYYGQESPQ